MLFYVVVIDDASARCSMMVKTFTLNLSLLRLFINNLLFIYFIIKFGMRMENYISLFINTNTDILRSPLFYFFGGHFSILSSMKMTCDILAIFYRRFIRLCSGVNIKKITC